MKRISCIVICLVLVNALTACSLFIKNAREFRLYQEEDNIVEISRVFVTEAENEIIIEVKETVNKEQFAQALQILRELPCTDPPFPPRDTSYGECFLIKYKDDSFQLLSECHNDYSDKEHNWKGFQSLDFDDEAFFALWERGLAKSIE